MNMNHLFLKLYTDKYGKILTREIAEEIVKDFAVTDGSGSPDGEHWNYEQSKEMGEKIGVNWELVSKAEYYTVLNMFYSDYGQTIKKHGLQDSFMGELAKDWFCDIDGEEDKTFNYFIHL